VVSSVSRLAGTALEPTGRAVAVIFFYASLVPLTFLLRGLNVGAPARLLTLLLVLSSPLYVFWSRAFLPESANLFLGLSYAALFVALLHGPKVKWKYVALVVVGVLAAASRLETFYPVVGLTIVLAVLAAKRRTLFVQGTMKRTCRLLAVAWMAPLVAGLLWAGYARHLQNQNPTPMMKTLQAHDAAQSGVGTLSQRFSGEFWTGVYRHITANNLTTFWTLLAGSAALLFLTKRWTEALVLLVVFLSGPILFPNFYASPDAGVHWYANGVFLLAVLAIALADLIARPGVVRVGAVAVALALPVAGWLGFRGSDYFKALEKNQTYERDLGAIIRARIDPDDVIMVIGDGANATIPYYSQRRALMPWQRGFDNDPGTAESLLNLRDEDRRLAALVVTGKDRADTAFVQGVIARHHFKPTPYYDDGRTNIYLSSAFPDTTPSASLLGLPVVSARVYFPVTPVVENGTEVWRFHSPSQLVAAVPASARSLHFSYAMARGSYLNGGKTNGAKFKISLLRPNGKREILLDRLLLPVTTVGDRGLHQGTLALDNVPGSQLVIETESNGSNLWDWTCWGPIEFK
jgi:hypothetical protein